MPVFVDTNVLVYARDATETEKQPRAAAWVEQLWDAHRGRLSFQVLSELYVTLTTKLSPGLPVAEARAEVASLSAWGPVVADRRAIELAWRLQDRHSLSFWDALIVAAAQIAGCEQLLTEDLTDGADYDGVVVIDPFAHSPA